MADDDKKTNTPGAAARPAPLRHASLRNMTPAPRLVSKSEQISLIALVGFVAERLGLVEDAVLRNFLDRFNIAAIPTLPSAQFDHAVKYLVDQIPDSAVA